MKHSFSILTAAAATLAAMIRSVIEAHVFNPADEAVILPEINAADVAKYASNGASDQEIADCFLVDVSLVQDRFGHITKSHRAKYKIGLRALQVQSAKKLAPSVLIFLGKNDLGQSNNPGTKSEQMPEVDDEHE